MSLSATAVSPPTRDSTRLGWAWFYSARRDRNARSRPHAPFLFTGAFFRLGIPPRPLPRRRRTRTTFAPVPQAARTSCIDGRATTLRVWFNWSVDWYVHQLHQTAFVTREFMPTIIFPSCWEYSSVASPSVVVRYTYGICYYRNY